MDYFSILQWIVEMEKHIETEVAAWLTKLLYHF